MSVYFNSSVVPKKNIMDYFRSGQTEILPEYKGLTGVSPEKDWTKSRTYGFKKDNVDIGEYFEARMEEWSSPGSKTIDITGAKQLKCILYGGSGGGGGGGNYSGREYKGTGGGGGGYTIATINVEGYNSCVLYCGGGGSAGNTGGIGQGNNDKNSPNRYYGAGGGEASYVNVSGDITVYAYGGGAGLDAVMYYQNEGELPNRNNMTDPTNGASAFTTSNGKITIHRSYPGQSSYSVTSSSYVTGIGGDVQGIYNCTESDIGFMTRILLDNIKKSSPYPIIKYSDIQNSFFYIYRNSSLQYIKNFYNPIKGGNGGFSNRSDTGPGKSGSGGYVRVYVIY